MRKFSIKGILNRFTFNQKFLVIYICCVIIPLIVTDGIILNALISAELNNRRLDRESEANAYKDFIISTIDYDEPIVKAVYNSETMYNFLTKTYASSYDYISAYNDFLNTSFFKTIVSLKSDKINIYVDNPTILNGSGFQQLSKHRGDLWYRKFMSLGTNEGLLVYYDNSELVKLKERKKVVYVKKIDHFGDRPEIIITIEHDVNKISADLKERSSKSPMFIVADDYVAFSNVPETDYESALNQYILTGNYKTVDEFEYRSVDFKIYVFSDEILLVNILLDRWYLILLLLLLTLVIPLLIMRKVEQSITGRILELQNAFGGDESGTFIPITEIDGSDEFASLMHNYNRIVAINNDLINTVYVDKLREHENDIARKNAELLALESQINPHFLFNALESIRMHSMLKGEDETAEMIEKLALMERQNCEWGNDSVTIKKEVEFIEAYLYLQSYRFGERLSFDIDIEPECEYVLIPKLTLVTFVENACVHGIESKSSQGWIFVRVYQNERNLYIEVEDTGDGMEENEVLAMSSRMNNVTLESLKRYKRVGILNACLRMKMMFEDRVKFDIESEKGVGLSVVITIPKEKLKKSE